MEESQNINLKPSPIDTAQNGIQRNVDQLKRSGKIRSKLIKRFLNY